MMVLAVTALLPDLEPTVRFKACDQVLDSRGHETLSVACDEPMPTRGERLTRVQNQSQMRRSQAGRRSASGR
jgi:hypothetical protein